MHEHITAAGFVVFNNEAIFGRGATADDAWADFLREMSDAYIIVVGEGEDTPDDFRSYVREGDYHIKAATAALIALVDSRGGNVAWEVARGVACTVAEFEAAP